MSSSTAQSWAIDSTATLTVAGNVSGPYALTKTGAGTLVCRGMNTMAGLVVNSGTLVLDNAGAVGAGTLTIGPAAAVQVTPGGSTVLVLPALTLDNTASLDLADNSLVVHHGDAARLQTRINQAYNDPKYNTPGTAVAGITTSAHTSFTTLGTLPGSAFILLHGSGTFGTFADVAPDNVLAKYTCFGDIDLDGLVTIKDYRLMDSGYLSGFDGVAKIATWADGNVNHDQIVNYRDFVLADAAAGQTSSLGQAMFAAHRADFGASYVAAYNAAVPEPATLALLIVAVGPSILRRRRRA